MARIIELCVLFLVLLSHGLHGSNQNQYKAEESTILHYEPIDRSAVALEDVSLKRGVAGFEEIAINIIAFGKTFTLNLVKNRDLFSFDSTVLVHGENGTLLKSYPTPLIAYKEKEEAPFHSRITIFDYENLQMKGVWATEDDTFYIDPVHEHAESMKRDIPVTVSHVIYRERDIKNNDIINSGDGKVPHFVFPKARGNHTAKRNQGDALSPNTQAAASLSPPPSPCPQTVKYFIQSVATDYKYVSKLGGEAAARREIINNWNVITALYLKTVNINIMLDEIVINTQSSSVEWNTPTCQTIENMLYSFSQWRGSRNKNAGLWHLLTNCFPPPGTVGLAWVSVTCETGGGLPSGTGVSTYLSGSGGYRVCAHETGHNFGAGHDVDGVMTASLQNIDFFSAATQAAMCNHIKTTTSRCYKDSPPNGITSTTRSSTSSSTSSTRSSSTSYTPTPTTTPRCVPSCTNKKCGSDGCGGTCGSCDNSKVCVYGVCQRIKPPCTPDCNRKNCGSDGCGGTCGTCSGSQSCSSRGVCQSTRSTNSPSTTTTSCIRSCAGKTCGFDGCSGSCGDCSYPQSCNFNTGQCQYIAYNPICTPVCAGKQCGFDTCGGSCGTCPKNQVCDIGTGLCDTAFIATGEDVGANNNTFITGSKNASSSLKNFSMFFLLVLAYIMM